MEVAKSATEARQQISCFWGKDPAKAIKHGEGNIRQSLKLMVFFFAQEKKCLKLKYTDPRLVESVRQNESMRSFLRRLNLKKLKTPSAIQSIGGGVLPPGDAWVRFVRLFCKSVFFLFEIAILEDVQRGLESIKKEMITVK